MCKFYNQTRSYRLFKRYKRFKYDLEYKDGYYERILYMLLALIVFCAVMVYILW